MNFPDNSSIFRAQFKYGLKLGLADLAVAAAIGAASPATVSPNESGDHQCVKK